VSLPDFDQIVKAIQNDGELAEKIILALNVGMWEEWDCDLLRGMLVVGFGPAELMLAAQAIPNDIDWSDDKVRDATPVHDIENRYTVRVCIHAKNSGPLKDLEREEVNTILHDEISHRLEGFSRAPWILEVEYA
jgi:uncharacterized Ntn-hydrolase superfamily protein